MNITTSKTFANFLQTEIKRRKIPYIIEWLQLDEDRFKWFVDFNIFAHKKDYHMDVKKFNVISVIYPPDYYAPQKYLTTKDLTNIYRKSDGSIDGFMRVLINEIEI